MQAEFLGGPFDGVALSYEVLRALYPGPDPPFYLVPPRAEWDKVLRGEQGATAVGPLHPYRCVFEQSGEQASTALLHDALADGSFAAWMENQGVNPGPAGQPEEEANPETPARFAARFKEFRERIQAATLQSATEVNLLCYCVDQQGQLLPPIRQSLLPLVQVEGLPGGLSSQLAQALYLDTIHQHLANRVLHAPVGFHNLDEVPFPVRILDFALEIEKP